ncbi:MAG: HNH endonuclease [Winogradskyella sp.]|uniref:HNH endonuclease n=1 Tax=Winogradskyella sp. TaxID=1883156 RepID=UPI00184A88E4|nr:HNH endonuclease [Winogradskyella sp.]MBT8244103.1 HNH endonuclease [Winogradskyella sp.]NNK23169.1 HNH endonuclease [Winogradskyella sp.]
MLFSSIKSYRGETWKHLVYPESHDILYSEIIYISNYGRLLREVDNETKLIKPYNLNGYPHVKIKTNKFKFYKNSKRRIFKGYYVHKLVANHFLEQGDGIYVIHLDYDKLNNEVRNLKWVTKREKELHQWKNPVFIEAKKKIKRPYAKLTENNVRLIKKILNNPNRRTRLKIIAKRFGVTTTQLNRIKSGENWADVPSL